MDPKTKLKWMKYSTVIGCILVGLPNGLFLYWGNMSTYCLSYIVNVADSTANINTPWVISIFFAVLPFGMGSANFLASRIGHRCTLLVGLILANIGIWASYFTVQVSLPALTLTLGIVLGFGTGLSNGSCLQLVVEWADKDVGKLTAIVQYGYPLGAVLINQFMTLLINPEGYVPEMTLGRVKYFAQKDLLDRVPSMFLVLGAAAVSVNAIGLSMIRKRPKEETLPHKPPRSVGGYSSLANSCDQLGEGTSSIISSENGKVISTDQPRIESMYIVPDNEKTPTDYHPKEMLKTASFYAIWISYAIGDLPLLLFTNYYKFFGQMWIENDLMLSVLGTVIIVINGLASVMWGTAMDKFGVKNCLAFLMSTDIIIMSWYYFTPMVHEWLYFVVTLLFGCFADSLYPCFTVATALLYGKTHFSTNFSIVMTASILLNFIAPQILESILSQFGFLGLFTFAASTTLLSLLLIFTFIPHI